MTDRRIQHNHTKVFFQSFAAKKKTKGAIVMDSGCGDGYASRAFITYSAACVFAYDVVLHPDPRFDHPRIKWYDSIDNIQDICDIVWSHHVIEHIENPIAYLRLLHDKLNDKGELWLSCPNTANNAVYSEGHIHNFTIANMVLSLSRAGYDVENIRWLINDGQIRVRVPKRGLIPSIMPLPFRQILEHKVHFNVSELPKVWRWNEE